MKNKKKLIGCLLGGVIILLIVVSVVWIKNNTKQQDKNNTNEIEMSETPYLDRDEEAIKKHLASYPNDSESLDDSGAFVVRTAYAEGWEHWNTFLDKVKKNEKCSIDIVIFTTEGNPIIMYWEYNGTDYYQLTDNTRDSDPVYKSGTYSYLNCIDIPEDEYDGIDFSKVNDTVKKVFLSNMKFDSYDAYDQYFNSSSYKDEDFSDAFTLWPLEKENFRDVIK